MSADGFGETYFTPLNDAQLALLGKITATFGQIEVQLDFIIAALAPLTEAATMEIMLAGKMFVAKADLVRKLAALKTPPETRAKVNSACDALTALAPLRNHAIHGCWGYLWDSITSKGGFLTEGKSPPEVAAYSAKRSDKPLMAQELEVLVRMAEDAARKVYEASRLITPGVTSEKLPMKAVFTAHTSFSKPPA